MNKFLPLTLALALGACSLAPDYRRPAAPVPAQWADQAAAAAALPALDRKTLFPDPRLQALIAAALEHNRDLALAAARVDEARALAGVARADRLPTMNLAASRAASLTPADLSAIGRPVNAQRYDVGFAVSAFELDFWGRLASLDAAARAGYLASEEARRAFRAGLVADVAGAYLSLLELQERQALAAATAKSREETRALVALRRDAGLASDLDVLAADGALQAVRADTANLARQRAAAENALQLLVGARPELPPGRRLADQAIVADVPAGLSSEILLSRPDVLAAEQKLVAAHANVGAARAAFLPRLALTASLGTASRALTGLFDAGSGAWAFQPALSYPLFDAGRSAANADLAEARKEVAVAEYEKALQQAFREVADLLAAREHLAVQLKAQEEAVLTQTERLKRVEARHRHGVAGYLEVLDAQRESFAAQQAALQTRRALLAAAAQFYKALGSGE